MDKRDCFEGPFGSKSLAFALLMALFGLLAKPLGAQEAGEAELVAVDSAQAAVDLPLEQERWTVDVDQQHASITIQQSYRNPSSSVLEGRFRLRAGQGASVTGYAYWNGEKKIVGEVFPREVAGDIYRRVTQRRRDPGLLEQSGEGSFQFRVFPIQPGELKRVELSYAEWLPARDGRVELRLPAASSVGSMVVGLRDVRGIGDVRSSSHRLELEQLGSGQVRVRVLGGTADQVVLSYTLANAGGRMGIAAHRDHGHDGYFNLVVPAPRGQALASPKALTLVLDRSGSMAGEALEQARSAAAQIVRHLNADDQLNVIWFDDDADALFARPKGASSDIREAALGFIERGREGGGTDLARGLEVALKAQSDQAGRLQVILFLTDGKSNAKRALEVAAADKKDVRVFTVGVGPQVDRSLLARLAKTKRGSFTYIERTSAIERRVADVYAQLSAPVLVDLELEVEGGSVQRVYPQKLPDLFQNGELRVSGRFRGDDELTLRITGSQQGRRVAFAGKIPPRLRTRPWVGRLWARSRVEHLLEQIALEGETAEYQAEAVDLSLAYNFVTPYTAFLAIPESELTPDAADLLDRARAKKSEALFAHADALALGAAPAPADTLALAGAPASSDVDEGDASPEEQGASEECPPDFPGCDVNYESTGERSSAMSVERRRGCGACVVGHDPGGGSACWIVLVAIAWRRIRRRHAQR